MGQIAASNRDRTHATDSTIRLAAHIQTIKKRLIIVGVTILVSLMVAFTFSADMVAWLNRPFPNPAGVLWTDGSAVRLDQSVVPRGGSG